MTGMMGPEHKLTPVLRGKPYVKTDKKGFGDISALIPMTGPNMNGIAIFSLNSAAAASIYAAMMAEDLAETMALLNGADKDVAAKKMEEIADGMGELTNQISGDARKKIAILPQNPLKIEAGTPTLMIGSHHMIKPNLQGILIAIPFGLDKVPDAAFTVEIGMEGAD
jgi:chemotaxis protein CheX